MLNCADLLALAARGDRDGTNGDLIKLVLRDSNQKRIKQLKEDFDLKYGWKSVERHD